MGIYEKYLELLKREGIPTFSMSQEQLKRANELLKELIDEKP